jgi:hypothetical protein
MGEPENSGSPKVAAHVLPASSVTEATPQPVAESVSASFADPERSRAQVPLVARLKAGLRRIDLPECAVVFALLALCTLVKLLWLTPPDVYTDAGEKWHFVRQWSYPNDIWGGQWSHHGGRLGINVPVYFVQKLCGTYVTAYYIAPVASFTLGVLVSYLVTRRLSGRAAGVVTALILIFFAGLTRSASQLLPDGFGATASVLVAYFLIRFEEEHGRNRLLWLIAAGVGGFYAYWIKESDVLIWPGVVIAVWLSKRSLREAGIVVATMLGLVALETAWFSLFTRYPHRFSLVQGVEDSEGWYPPIKFVQLFDRFTKLDPEWQMLFWAWVPSVLWLAGSKDKRTRPVVLIGISFMFLLTFLVKSINPLVQWTAFKSRYLAVAAPFFAICIAMLAVEAWRRIWEQQPERLVQRVGGHLAKWGAAYAVGLCLVLGYFSYRVERDSLANHPFVLLKQQSAILNDAYRRNLPIGEASTKSHGLNTIAQIYINDKYLAQADSASGGRLPDIPELVRKSKGTKDWSAHLLRDASAYKRGELQELIEQGCAITVKAKGGVKLDRTEKLPAHCKAPRGKPIAR